MKETKNIMKAFGSEGFLWTIEKQKGKLLTIEEG